MEHAADGGSISQYLSQITECSICLQTWTNPRSLPSCDHIFCLQCLKTYMKEKEGGKTLCPVCREEFGIPDGGLDALPKNFLHGQLLEAHRTLSLPEQSTSNRMTAAFQEHTQVTSVLCELCVNKVIASGYCVDCDQSICSMCSTSHLRARASRNHKILEVTARHNPELISKFRSSYCELHKEEQVKLFCDECNVVACVIFYATKHVGHKGSAIEEAATAFLERLALHGSNVERIFLEKESKFHQLMLRRKEFLEMMSNNELKLQDKKEEIKRNIEEEAVQLWKQLIQMKEKCLKDLNIRVEEAERDLAAVQGVKGTFSELIANRVDFGYICRSAHELLTQIEVLRDCTTDESSSGELDLVDVRFNAAVLPDRSGYEIHLVGVIDCVTDRPSQAPVDNKKPITLDHLLEQELDEMKSLKDQQMAVVSDLKDQLQELKKQQSADVLDLTEQHKLAVLDLKKQLQEYMVKQKKSEEESVERENRIKSLEELLTAEMYFELLGSLISKPLKVQLLNAGAKGVCGVAVVYGILYIVQNGSSLIPVFNSNNLSRMSSAAINIGKDLHSPQLAACFFYNCLYVSSSQPASDPVSTGVESVIYRVDLSNNSFITWKVLGYCKGLSVTKYHNLLVTLSSRQVQEYTTEGSLIKEIILHDSIDNPQHCVQLSTGNFVVSHWGSREHRVCKVNADGQIINTYGGSPGGAEGQFNHPCELSVDICDHVSVADRENNRIQLLHPTLTHFGYIQQPAGRQLHQPHLIHLDEINGRLYIGQLARGSVVVLEALCKE